MRVSCVQMDMRLPQSSVDVDHNYEHAKELIRSTCEREYPDVVVLPETWNVGFFPKENLEEYCDKNGERTKSEFGALAKELNVNIVAGSVADVREGKVWNTAYVFDRSGECVYSYDKIHLFSPSGEHHAFESGDHYARFQLDSVNCGLIICYDIRFCELVRSVALQGIDILFVVSQWPAARARHLDVLAQARAIENQMFLVLTNSCGTAYTTTCGGGSMVIDPWGVPLARAGTTEEVITAELDMSVIEGIRNSINVFNDRRPNLYRIDGGRAE